MHVALFGATGATGLDIIQTALDRGDSVTAFCRSSEGLPQHERLTVVRGDIHDVAAVATAIEGCDGIISVLGFRRHLRGPSGTTLYSDSARTFVEAMQRTGVRRIVFCSSAGVEDHDPNAVWVYEHLVRPLWLKPTYEDMAAAEKILRDSDLDWVIVRPGRLTDGPATGQFRVEPRFRPDHGNDISRADLAAFMLDQVTSDTWLHQTPTLGY